MDSYYSSSYSSSSSQNLGEAKRQKHAYPLHQSQYRWLHSVSKSQAKPWRKAPVAPAMPPKPVKVYKVDALNFRELVQQLTGARAAATSVEVHRENIADASPPVRSNSNWYYQFQSEAFGLKFDQENTDGVVAPSYSSWCSFPPLSPTTISSLEPNKVL